MIKYYLFGLDLVNEYTFDGLDSAILKLKRDPSIGIIYKFNQTTENINTLLNDFSGWGDFCEIDKLTYDKIYKKCK